MFLRDNGNGQPARAVVHYGLDFPPECLMLPGRRLGIIPRYGGLIVLDGWKAYLTYTQCKHQLCGAHLLAWNYP